MLDPAKPPDAVYRYGALMTMDSARPEAQALAVQGGRLLAVGSDSEISALASPATQRVDLRGKFVLPGFHDAHTHQGAAGNARLELDLSGVRTLQELQQRTAAWAQTLAEGEWILGAGWDQTLWPGQAFPTRQDLDPYTGGHPAFLQRLDTHAAVANSVAMHAAGISRASLAPAGGEIGKDARGEPNGMLFEGARGLVSCRVPPKTAAQRRRALRLSMQEALAHGVTSVQDCSDWETFLAYEQMQQAGELRIRVCEWLAFKDPLETLVAQRAHHDTSDPWLHTGMLKAFMDGSLGSRTAAMFEAYQDDPGNCGHPQYEPSELNTMAAERARAGFQLGFHAIGDRAVGMALDAFAAAPSSRPRIEHLQVMATPDIARLRRLGVIASVQPSHLLEDLRWAEARLGPERAQASYLWRTLLRAGVVLAFGTDVPVAPVNPMLAMYAALTRSSLDGEVQYPPSGEALSLHEALYAYTMGGAITELTEATKGSLTPGKWADFVVLSQDLRGMSPAQMLETEALLTVVGGEVMHAAPDWETE